MKTFEEQERMLDEFFEQIVAQTKAFIEENELIPLGHRYEFSVSARRRRTEVHLTTKKKMSSVPRWHMTHELPSNQDWEGIFSLAYWDPAKHAPDSGPAHLRGILTELKENNSGDGMYVSTGYVSRINKILEDANSEFRLFSRGYDKYALRRMG